jgi:hypothetical protein
MRSGWQLVEENAKLKRIVADLSLDKAMLQDALSKKFRNLPAGASLSTRPRQRFSPEGVDRGGQRFLVTLPTTEL